MSSCFYENEINRPNLHDNDVNKRYYLIHKTNKKTRNKLCYLISYLKRDDGNYISLHKNKNGPLLRSNICIKSTLNVLYKNKQETSLRSHCIFYFVKYLILPPTAKFFKLADCQIQIRAQDGSCTKIRHKNGNLKQGVRSAEF